MKIGRIEFDVDDDFEVGDCRNCSLSYYDEYFNSICPIGWSYDKCFIEIKEND